MSTPTIPDNNQPAAKKKPNGCLVAIVTFVVIMAFGAVFGGINKDNDADAAPTATPVATEAPTAKPTEAPASSEASSTDEVSTDSIASLVKLAVKDNFDDVDVSVDGDIITVNIKQNGVAADFYSLTQGDANVKDAWDQLVQNQVSLCDQFKKSASDLERDDIMFIVQLLNDVNPDNVLVSVMDGTVYYNAADDVQ